jgi:hypothetical protein
MKILMTLWRIWFVRNEVVHHKPAPTIESSKRFLCSYLESLISIKRGPNADVVKGKTVVSSTCEGRRDKEALDVAPTKKLWSKPPSGMVKLNVDGSFNEAQSNGGCGMILQDDNGAIVINSWFHRTFFLFELIKSHFFRKK